MLVECPLKAYRMARCLCGDGEEKFIERTGYLGRIGPRWHAKETIFGFNGQNLDACFGNGWFLLESLIEAWKRQS
jgi:hypothetical protein